MAASSTFVDLCEKELELCGVKEGETVAVLSQLDERIDYADAFMAAARKLGATPFNVRLPEASTSLLGDAGAWTVGETPLADNAPALESLKSADIVIDLMFLLFSKEQLEIQQYGSSTSTWTRIYVLLSSHDTPRCESSCADQTTVPLGRRSGNSSFAALGAGWRPVRGPVSSGSQIRPRSGPTGPRRRRQPGQRPGLAQLNIEEAGSSNTFALTRTPGAPTARPTPSDAGHHHPRRPAGTTGVQAITTPHPQRPVPSDDQDVCAVHRRTARALCVAALTAGWPSPSPLGPRGGSAARRDVEGRDFLGWTRYRRRAG